MEQEEPSIGNNQTDTKSCNKIEAECKQVPQEQELQEQEHPSIGNNKIDVKSNDKIKAECDQVPKDTGV